MTDIAATRAELRTLLAAAKTKPPWTWVATGPGEGDIALGGAEDPDGEFAILAPHVCPACAERGASCMAPSQSDAALIVAAVNALPALLADTPSVEPAGLEEAWRAAEAALPDGWLTLTLSKRAKSDIGPYSAAVHDGSEGAMAIRSGLAVGHGSTPEIALQRLAARLLPTQASDS